MAWFKRRKGAREAIDYESMDTRALVDEVEHAIEQDDLAGSSGPRFWLDHGFEDGDRVECAVCGTSLVVTLIKYSRITLSVAGAQAGSPLICGDCGRLFCVECSLRRHPNRPSCDRCQRVGGVTGLMK